MTKIVFMGTPDFSVPILEQIVKDGYQVSLVVTQPDRPKGRKKILTPPPVKVAAQQLNIPVFQPEKIREDYQVVLDEKPDLIVTAAFGQILPNPILDEPELGCINVHASLLPAYRGGAPIHQAIIDGKKETGVTIMYMTEALDAGDMIAKRAIPIEEDDHVGSMFEKLSAVGRELLSETLPQVVAGTINPEKQNEAAITFAPNIKREQEVIDWQRSNLEIYNQVRGLHPWPVAVTSIDHTPLKLWWVVTSDEETSKAPGTIIEVTKDAVVIQAGQGSIVLTDVQLAGKKRMAIKDYLNGNHPFEVGKVLGKLND